MAVRLAVPAVVAANRRLNDTLAVVSWREPYKTGVACMRAVSDIHRGRGRRDGVPRNRLANQGAKVVIRDFH
jgi:hypothetical protein